MLSECLEVPQVTHRNFNLCPHCALNGEQTLLCRLCEGLPMISRSDGETFHLLLADRPAPYPPERDSGPTRKFSVRFWYSHIRQPQVTCSTLVILLGARSNHPVFFRKLETVADLLAEELAGGGQLAEVYELFEDPSNPNAA